MQKDSSCEIYYMYMHVYELFITAYSCINECIVVPVTVVDGRLDVDDIGLFII